MGLIAAVVLYELAIARMMEYQRGINAPVAMKALLKLLTILDDQEIVRVVREWGEKRNNYDYHQQN